jgi:hypothetical protein
MQSPAQKSHAVNCTNTVPNLVLCMKNWPLIRIPDIDCIMNLDTAYIAVALQSSNILNHLSITHVTSK